MMEKTSPKVLAMMALLAALPIGTLGAAALWAADVRYVQVTGLAEVLQEQKIENLSARIEELVLKQKLGMTDAYEDALLEQLKARLGGL